MSEEINAGGAAFPTLDDAGSGLGLREWGLSKRDYFAAKALQGMLSNCTGSFGVSQTSANNVIARSAYALADAMLRAREGDAA